jgi:acyl transferase domain-containing protein
LTAPNGSAQRILLRVALSRAGCEEGEAACLEAHGTGTALGDPTEGGSLAAVHGARDRRLGWDSTPRQTNPVEEMRSHTGESVRKGVGG